MKELFHQLERIAAALEIQNGTYRPSISFQDAPGYIWTASTMSFKSIKRIDGVPLDHLIGIDRQKKLLLNNTRHFAQGRLTNNVLLWGARGMGKSSLVKSVFQSISQEFPNLRLVEVAREDIEHLPEILDTLRDRDQRFIVYCDDLSFDQGDKNYKPLKTILDGSIEGRPQNVLFYATSNRRHIVSRDMIENEQSTALIASEAVEDKVSLSDRFGLWIGIHGCSEPEFLEIVLSYRKAMDLNICDARTVELAKEWAQTRGSRSGRVARQFILDLETRLQKPDL